MSYKCENYEKEFKKPQFLKRHLNKKFPCVKKEKEPPIQINLFDNKCPYCNIKCKNKNLNKHFRDACKIISESKRKFYIKKFNNNVKHLNTEKKI